MKQINTDIAIVGAGSAGLCAAIQAAKIGATVMVFDENDKPGGQLFKQIHKFFGSHEHHAGIRGFTIGEQLLEEVEKLGVHVYLNSVVWGIFDENTLGVIHNEIPLSVNAKKIILAGGAKENYMAFPGSTLPGVMGAGAAQTMINVNRVLPGWNILVIGSGNVGLIVSYQILQAGATVTAVVDGASTIGGYGVHASKISRAGVPIILGHTIVEAYGEDEVQGAVIAAIDDKWQIIPGSEQKISCDTICLAVGLNPMAELAFMAGCKMIFIPELGGHVPIHNEHMQTTVPNIYVAGDITGVEEASTAMEEGNLAGFSAAQSLCQDNMAETEEKIIIDAFRNRMDILRSGEFGDKRRTAKLLQIESFHKYKEGADV